MMQLRQLIRETILKAGEPFVDQFGDTREVVKNSFGWSLPKETFESRVKSQLVSIIMEENQISEKDFSGVDAATRKVKLFFECSDDARKVLEQLKTESVRHKYAAECIYNQWSALEKKSDKDGLHEEKRSREKKLKDNKVKLTDEERAEIITKGATWDDGKPGIWKSVDNNGKIHYCSNTHRAMSVSTTLSAAIKKFPFIKSTS